MRTAAQRLQEITLPIHEIAARMGYEDAYRFSHQFRRVFSTSPRKYRERQKQGASWRDSPGGRPLLADSDRTHY